ncbi:MAG: aldo/keto reductase [Ilumatobacter sp.]|uniref:aldo/keto reductase n=2 Tax=Ilumatobacter sp. TaxID=1967498 RepID=UPI003299D879
MLPRAPFGRTGHDSTRVIFGAAALGGMSQERADATMANVVEWGIDHIDTAASYGASEDRLRPFLAEHRASVFLATKTGERTGAAARAELEKSLERMDVDHVDLIQLHNLVDPDEWDTAFSPGGAIESLATARDEGLVKHIGVTGHGVPIAGMHVRSLERFDFASVLLPINFVMLDNPAYRSDVERLLDVCADRKVAVQTIKSIARGMWADGDTNRFSWYEPLTDPEPIGRAVRYVLSHPQMFLNTTSDARLVPMIVDAARGDLSAPTDDEMRADVEREGITPLFVDGERSPI